METDDFLGHLIRTLSPARLALVTLAAPAVTLITQLFKRQLALTGRAVQIAAAVITLVVYGLLMAFGNAWPNSGQDALAVFLAVVGTWLAAVGVKEVVTPQRRNS
jgi:Ca2+/H+ antiporter